MPTMVKRAGGNRLRGCPSEGNDGNFNRFEFASCEHALATLARVENIFLASDCAEKTRRQRPALGAPEMAFVAACCHE